MSVAGALLLLLLLVPVRVFLKARFQQKPLRVEVEYRVFQFIKGRVAFDERRLGPYREKIERFNWRTLLTPEGRKELQAEASRLRSLPQRFRAKAGPGHQQYAFRAVLRSMYVEKLQVRASIGSSDAARTGYLVGVAWALAGAVHWVCRQFLRVATGEPRFSIAADFNSRAIGVAIEATLRGQIGPVAVALLRQRLSRRAAVGHNRRYANAN